MRKQAEIDELLAIANEQSQRSAARDYWEGINDALLWVNGEMNPAIEAWLQAKRPNPWKR